MNYKSAAAAALPYLHGRSDPVHRHSQSICRESPQTPGSGQGCPVHSPKSPHRRQSIRSHNADISTCNLTLQWDCKVKKNSVNLSKILWF